MLNLYTAATKIEDMKVSSNNKDIDTNELVRTMIAEFTKNPDFIKALAREIAIESNALAQSERSSTINLREAMQILQLSKRRIGQLRKIYPEIAVGGKGSHGYNREAVELLARNRRMRYAMD